MSFAVQRGEVVCLLGPDGAGKTTITEIREGHRLPTAGAVSVLGADPGRGHRELRADRRRPAARRDPGGARRRGAARDARPLVPPGAVAGAPRRPRRVRRQAGAKAGELSVGQRRRLDLALGLVGDPDVLFLDEPTTGFDPHARRNAWSTLRTLCDTGETIFLTTHFMDEAQFLVDRVAVMNAGEIVAIGPPEALGGRDELPTEIASRSPRASRPATCPRFRARP